MGRTQLSTREPAPHFLEMQVCHMAAFASLGFVDEAEAQRGCHACPRPYSPVRSVRLGAFKAKAFPVRTGRLWTPYP